jgi:hypothetical protein
MKKIALLSGILLARSAHAVCPVCTVAIGAGLEGARLLGVDDVITGIWAGAFTMVMVFWTAKYMAKKGVRNALWYLLDLVVWYAFIAALYLTPGMEWRAKTLWGADKFALGVAVGSVVFYAAERWNRYLLKKNGGKSRFKFQKVVIPFGSLLAVSALFTALLYA